MNYSQYYPIDVVNGPGTRATLFVAGCEHQCKGCYNQSTWSPRSGIPFTDVIEDAVIKDLNDQRIPRRGLSLSGGDPLHPENIMAILRLVTRVKQECIGKDIWLWTGYLLDELSPEQKQIVAMVDVVVDGKFIQEEADPSLQWRGSANQVIHYLK
jgi:anaerobic ribonucleoside-triphosphate reductase activating protein